MAHQHKKSLRQYESGLWS